MRLTLPALLKHQAEALSDRRAVEAVGGPSLTFAELWAGANDVAQGLVARGIQRGDRVALAFPNANACDYAAAYFGVQLAGGACVALNPRAPGPERRKILEDSGAQIVLSAAEPLPRGETDVALPNVELNDMAEVMYTSGTTGTPKGVAVTHAAAIGEVKPAPGFPVQRAFLNPMPIHTFAASTFLIRCVAQGLTNLVLPKFEVERYIELLRSSEVLSTYGVPAMWIQVLKHLECHSAETFKHVRGVSFGAAPMPAWGVEKIAQVFPRAAIQNIYGLTEAGGLGCMMKPGDHVERPGTVGRPVGATQVRIVDENGAEQPAGQPGGIELCNPDVPQRRYFGDTDQSDEIWKDDGWIATGDIGYLDDDGYLYLVDRAKDVVIQGGSNVGTAEVESVLLAHPKVMEAAVFGTADPVLGEVVTAAIVVQQAVDDDELKKWAGEQVSAYKVPKIIHQVSALPRNAMGKVLKNKLREEFA